MSIPIAKENRLHSRTESEAEPSHELAGKELQTRKKLRRTKAFTAIDRAYVNRPFRTPRIIEPTTVELIIEQANQLFANNLLHQARDTLLRITFKTGPVYIRLHEINREIKAREPQSTTQKKTIRQKLDNNLFHAKKQQREERGKTLLKYGGIIKPSIELSHSIVQPLLGTSVQIAGKTVGIAHCQGIRPTMEDAFLATELEFTIEQNVFKGELYGVFDGHGGTNTTDFLSANLAYYLIASLEKNNASGLTEKGIYAAFIESFTAIDDACAGFKDGATVTVAFVLGDKVWVANCGDARTILSDNQVPVQLSHDAKITDARFIKKVEKAGGVITPGIYGPRVQKLLNCAGSIGDRYIIGEEGNCCIPSKPQVVVHPFQKGKSFVFLACDGYFDLAMTDDTITWINLLLQGEESTENISKRLVYSVLESGSTDNVTAILVPL